MFPNVEVRHLQAVIVLADDLNFTRAAQRLRITQPGLSKQITEIEEQLSFHSAAQLQYGNARSSQVANCRVRGLRRTHN